MTAPITVERLNLTYHCDDCDTTWNSEWCCACDDDCPVCGRDISPEDDETLETFTLAPGETCPVCNSPHDLPGAAP